MRYDTPQTNILTLAYSQLIAASPLNIGSENEDLFGNSELIDFD